MSTYCKLKLNLPKFEQSLGKWTFFNIRFTFDDKLIKK